MHPARAAAMPVTPALAPARRTPRPAGAPGGGPGGRKFFRRKKVCKFCTEKIDAITYRDVRLLQGFVAERGKIVPRRLTGVCTRHQRRLSWPSSSRATSRCWPLLRASNFPPHIADLMDTRLAEAQARQEIGEMQWKSF